MPKVGSESLLRKQKTDAILKVKEYYKEKRSTQTINNTNLSLNLDTRYTDLRKIQQTSSIIQPKLDKSNIKIDNENQKKNPPLQTNDIVDKNINYSEPQFIEPNNKNVIPIPKVINGNFSDKELVSNDDNISDADFESFNQLGNCTINTEGEIYKSFSNYSSIKGNSLLCNNRQEVAESSLTNASMLNDLSISELTFKKGDMFENFDHKNTIDQINIGTNPQELKLDFINLYKKNFPEIHCIKESDLQNKELDLLNESERNNMLNYYNENISEADNILDFGDYDIDTEFDIDIAKSQTEHDMNQYRYHSSRRTEFYENLMKYYKLYCEKEKDG